ncbi:hypothetical protein ACEQ2M_002854 [Vibrio parahaemolyticus]
MLLFSKGDCLDLKIAELSDLLALLDSRLEQLMEQAESSIDADSLGIFDRAEYFIGVGFVAMQQYISDTMYKSEVSNKTYLSISNVVDPENYPLSNVLAFLIGERKFCLSSAIPLLEQWRDQFSSLSQEHT